MYKKKCFRLLGIFLVLAVLIGQISYLSVFADEEELYHPIMFEDDFDDGNADGWRTDGGTWTVIDGEQSKVYARTDYNDPGFSYLNIPSAFNWTDYMLEADVTITQVDPAAPADNPPQASISVRYHGKRDRYAFVLVMGVGEQPSRVEIRKRIPAEIVLAAMEYPVELGKTYRVQGYVYGNKLELWIDGVKLLEASDDSLASGTICLNNFDASAQYDNVKVYNLSVKLPMVDSYLSGLVLAEDPELNNEIPWTVVNNVYYAEVPYAVDEIYIQPTVTGSVYSIDIDGIYTESQSVFGPLELSLGENRISMEITKQGTIPRKYQLVINRSDILFRDDFEENETGKVAAGWKVDKGTWAVVDTGSSLAYEQTAGTAGNIGFTFPADSSYNNWTDYSVETDITIMETAEDQPNSNPPQASLSVRFKDRNNRYAFVLNTGEFDDGEGGITNRIEIRKKINNVEEPIVTKLYDIEIGKTYKVKGVVNGNKLEFWIDGVKELEATNDERTAGTISLNNFASRVRYDNVIVRAQEPLPPEPTPEPEPTPPETPTVAPKPLPDLYNCYFGATHAHTDASASHGDLNAGPKYFEQNTPDLHFQEAINNGFDFYFITDHSQYTQTFTPEKWENMLVQADLFTVDGQFVAVRGFEFSENDQPNGHMNIWNTEDYISAADPGVDFPYMHQWLREQRTRSNAYASFNHPGTSDFNDFGYLSEETQEIIRTIEVINAVNPKDSNGMIIGTTHYQGFLKALEKGWKVSPIAGFDGHLVEAIHKLTYRCGLVAEELTRDALMEAIGARRTYATFDKNLEIQYMVNDVWMGSEIPNNPGRFEFNICVSDPDTGDENDKITRIEIMKDNGELVTWQKFDAHSVQWTPVIEDTESDYFFLRVWTKGKTDGPTAYVAPVWIDRSQMPETGLTLDELVIAKDSELQSVISWEIIDGVYSATVSGTIEQVYMKPVVDSDAEFTLTLNGIEINNREVAGPLALNVGTNTFTLIISEAGKQAKEITIKIDRLKKVSMKVDRSNVLVEREGNNIIGLCLSWISDSDQYERLYTMEEVVKNHNFGTLRWPMGTLAMKYVWNTMDENGNFHYPIQPRFIVPEELTNNFPWAATDVPGVINNEMNFDEFLALCQKTGATPVIDVNVGGDLLPNSTVTYEELLKMAEEQVRYAKEKGFTGLYWELGNEVEKIFTAANMPGTTEAERVQEYINRYHEFYDLMKAQDPTAKIGVGLHLAAQKDNWHMPVMIACRDKMDFVVTHQYGAHGYGANATYEAYVNNNNPGNHTIRKIHMISDYIDELADQYGEQYSDIEILVTEYSGHSSSGWKDYAGGVIYKAIHTFEMMAEMLNHPRVGPTHFWITRTPWDAPDLETLKNYDNSTRDHNALYWDGTLTPMGKSLAVLAENIHDAMVYTETSDFRNRPYASYDDETNSLTVYLLNRENNTVSAEVVLDNYDASGMAVSCWVFEGKNGLYYDTEYKYEEHEAPVVEGNKFNIELSPASITVVKFTPRSNMPFVITDTSISKDKGIEVSATVSPNDGFDGGTAAVVFKLMKGDTVIGLYSSEQEIKEAVRFNVQFHGYSGDDYKVKIYVWDKLDSSIESVGVNQAEPVEVQ